MSLQQLLSPEQLPLVEKALQHTFPGLTPSVITTLPGGLSAARVFKIEVADKAYLLKADQPTPHNTTRFSALQLAATAGIAPAAYYLDAATGISITGFINTVPLRQAFPQPAALLTALAQTIKAMHALPALPGKQTLYNTVQPVILQLKQASVLPAAAVTACMHHFNLISEQYPWNDTDKVFSHNDLNPGNIVCDGETIWIIDWEAAFQNDRYVDIAITANFFVTSEAEESIFLTSYFGAVPGQYQRARFFIMRQLCRLVFASLLLQSAGPLSTQPLATDAGDITLAAIGSRLQSGELSLSTPQGRLLYAISLFNEAQNNMQQPRFNEALAALSLG